MKIKERKQLINFWNRSKKYYEETLFGEPKGTLKQIVKLINSYDLILDVGSGIAQLSQFIDSNYVGIEISRLAIKSAPTDTKVHLINALAEKLPFKNGKFDKILLINSLEHMFAPRNVLLECYRVCKLGGDIIIHGPAYDFPISIPPSFHRKSKINIHKIRFYLNRIRSFFLTLIGFDRIDLNIISSPHLRIINDQFISDSDLVYISSIKQILNFLKRLPGQLKYVRRGNNWYNKLFFTKYWFIKLYIVFNRGAKTNS